ncbi:hypothetical protein LTR99_006787 [Exophiala xenobiotica]|uniref:Uncharacterized protein n=1 Tax=Vermiconidia calcicola TaxID=1690605 RepID=A0AAV9Q1I0_9PEZI|nr:hypothetical protein H2202_001506 [Exophiala xenobiotica]KAK5531783.1 hypothetical protein LTR25_008113 [Vermiconidia calcicola]KAK5542748.1 hypothetical protein LTR23_005358 [Chaetothyriales sp. CCFEE 6169]KAK5204730.1 hypothetical protein LTR41_009586 [Exophiala xenobiotica]KAK5221390.1 hypothetical protein LTR72_006950 [Exophiala xenobiotica]
MSSHTHTHGHTPGHPTTHTKAVDPSAPSHQHLTNHPTHDDAPNPADNTGTFQSSDPTTNADAKPTSKIMGDLKGMAQGISGSMQAATGTLLRNKNMQEKGFEKMSEEDQRLAAKSGKAPVGTTAVDENHPQAASYGPGRTTTELSK